MNEKMRSKRDVLLASLVPFYEDTSNLKILTDVRSAEKPNKCSAADRHVSLRTLDWLVTNMAKKRNIVYQVQGKDGPVVFNMYLQYKAQLKAYSKRFFDPFRRRERVVFHDSEGRPVKTTVGQLNFFRWAIVNGVIEYGSRHLREIEEDMFASQRSRNASRSATRRRRELSKPAMCGLLNTHVPVVLRFT